MVQTHEHFTRSRCCVNIRWTIDCRRGGGGGAGNRRPTRAVLEGRSRMEMKGEQNPGFKGPPPPSDGTHPPPPPPPRTHPHHCSEDPVQRGWQGSFRRGGGVWDPKLCVPKMAGQKFPDANFAFSHDGHFGLEGGGVRGGGT